MRWQGRRESDNVEDRRGQSSGLGGGGFRVPVRGKGGIVILVVVLVAGYYGIDLSPLLNGGNVAPQGQQQSANISPKDDELAKFTSVVLASTEDNWKEIFQRMGKTYQPPKLVMYRGVTRTSCGTGQAAMGPFYCPGDRTVYIDLSFYQDMKTKLGAGGDFAQAYVVAHEVGHHVQNLLGIEKQQMLEEGDLQAALNAAQAIGDDRLQQQSQGRVVPDSFTHGTSQQRYTWFKQGFDSGDPNTCNTFASR